MVDRHPDSATLLAFREHRLSGHAVAEVAHHVGACARCAKAEPPAGRVALQALVSRSADDHLSDEELDSLIDNRVQDPHVASCAMCRTELEDLRRFALECGGVSRRFESRWLLAAAVVIAVLALSAIVLVLRRTTPDAVPVAAKPVHVAQPAPREIASLADGSGRIALLEDGTIAGVEVRSSRDAEDARAVLSGGALKIPTFIAAMPGAVRGAASAPHPLRALEPFRSAVREPRPRFTWTPVRGARSYRVAVFDADYEEIARSEPLNDASWMPSKPLPAGVDLSWHVVAETAAGELSSAGSDRAEAVFRVLTPKETADVRLGEDQYRDSHLLRGLLYSRHGLLHDAEREFRRLADENPGSPIARNLIASVSR